MAREFQRIGKMGPGNVGVMSRDRADTRWLIVRSTDRTGACWYLWERATGKATLLLMGLVAAAVTLLWVRNLFGFGAGLVVTAVIFGLWRLLPRPAASFAASFLAWGIDAPSLRRSSFEPRKRVMQSCALGTTIRYFLLETPIVPLEQMPYPKSKASSGSFASSAAEISLRTSV